MKKDALNFKEARRRIWEGLEEEMEGISAVII